MNHVNENVVRLPFEDVLDMLKEKLRDDGFEIGGTTDFQNPLTACKVTNRKHKVLSVYYPFLYREMMMLATVEGMVLPCMISLVELYPGETLVVPYNPTESIAREMSFHYLENLSHEVGKRLQVILRALETGQKKDPDLVTSWS